MSMDADLYTEALSKFSELLQEAKLGQEIEPTAMTVATSSLDGKPTARVVLLKSFDTRGFVFYTHLNSGKGQELQKNPQAALLFLWRSLREAGVQVRIEGHVINVPDDEADRYFASRPRKSQIGAWASLQSQPLEAREIFEQRIAEIEMRFNGQDVPRPSSWGGFCVVPTMFEFWEGAEFRLHQRLRYQKENLQWIKQMLYP